jgi:hypothetical protein
VKVADLTARRPLTAAFLPGEVPVYRIQLPAPRPTSVVIGAVFMSPLGTMAYRFDLPAQAVGYFAMSEAAAVYETLARRDVRSIVLATVKARHLLTARLTTAGLRLADLRPHTTDWPVLQAGRYATTQTLAEDLQAQGFDGLVYRSAQQHAADCLALFGPANAAVASISSMPLFDAARMRLHRAVVDGARGSVLPVV